MIGEASHLWSVRADVAVRGRRGRRGDCGYTLMEALIVVAIVGLLAGLGYPQIMRSLQRANLDKTSNDLRTLIQRGVTETQRKGLTMFVQIGPLASSTISVKLIADSNGNGQLDGGDALVTSLDFPIGDTQQIALSSAALDQIETTGWDITNPNAPVLMCDFQGRAIRPDTGLQIDQPAILRFTHANMLRGTLQPRVRYELHISPLWNVTLERQVRNAAGVWMAQAGQI